MDHLSFAQSSFLKDLSKIKVKVNHTIQNGSSLPVSIKNRFWRAVTGPSPLVVVEPASVEEIQSVLNLADTHDIPVSLIAGGHDNHARSLASENAVLDLVSFKEISYDEKKLEVTVGGAVTFDELLEKLPPGYEIAMGGCRSVGVVGWHLGGGYGHMSHVLGMGSDRIIRAKVVTADGKVHLVSEDDLMWMLRGGGAGIGVVVEMTLQVTKLPEIHQGDISFPLTKREAVQDAFKTYQSMLSRYPDEMSVLAAMATVPSLGSILNLTFVFHGPSEAASKAFDELASMKSATVVKPSTRKFSNEIVEPGDSKLAPKGLHYQLIPINVLHQISPATVNELIQAHLKDPHGMLVIHDAHGAACRPRFSASFPVTETHFFIEVISLWGREQQVTDELSTSCRKWGEDLAAAIRHCEGENAQGGLVTMLGPNDAELAKAWYGSKLQELQAKRKKWDPKRRFRGAYSA